jgi:predicted nucleic acid-binding protein
MLLGSGRFQINITVPLVLEYEDVARRLIGAIPLTETDIDDIIDSICHTAVPREVYYLWRPLLKDLKDDMVLEVAVAGGCDFIVTFNRRDFQGAEVFGIRIVTPKEFLQEIGALS